MRDELSQVISGHRRAYRAGASVSEPLLVFPGAFNPLHDGHCKMAAIASEQFNQQVHYEISVLNVDKRSLTREEAASRISQFDSNVSVWLTRCATFIEKAQLFPGATFIVGADTAIRLLDMKYYRDEIARDEALALLVEKQCQFLVFGRLIDGNFMTASALPLPEFAEPLFLPVPMSRFREEISSTELRRKSESD